MSDPLLDRQVRRRLAVLRHVEEVTGNVAMTCRYYRYEKPLPGHRSTTSWLGCRSEPR